jgi:YD repeat-containing protein
VDVATGDVILSQADVTLAGMLPMVLERTHRSSHRTGRWLGTSWLSSFDQRLLVQGDQVLGAFADGRVLTWDRDSGDGKLPRTGPAWPLRRDDGAYVVTDPQRGLTWRFESRPGYWSSGLGGGLGELPLVAVTDRAGHSVVFEYDSSGQPAAVAHSAAQVASVTGPAGHVTRYQWDSRGRVRRKPIRSGG